MKLCVQNLTLGLIGIVKALEASTLTRFHLRDVDEMILRGRRQHLAVVAEAQRPGRPIQPAGEPRLGAGSVARPPPTTTTGFLAGSAH